MNESLEKIDTRRSNEVELTGFTLFQTSKGWQLSTRQEGDNGWSVKHVSY